MEDNFHFMVIGVLSCLADEKECDKLDFNLQYQLMQFDSLPMHYAPVLK